MVRLFLKLYGVLIATLVVSFVAQTYLVDYVYREMASGFDFRQHHPGSGAVMGFNQREHSLLGRVQRACTQVQPGDFDVRVGLVSCSFRRFERRASPFQIPLCREAGTEQALN